MNALFVFLGAKERSGCKGPRQFCEASELAEKEARKRRRERQSISPRQKLKNG